ncbi:hypothetical protein ACVIJU_001336 [Aeribacillus sp. SP014]
MHTIQEPGDVLLVRVSVLFYLQNKSAYAVNEAI